MRQRQILSKIGECTGLGCHDFSVCRTSLASSVLLVEDVLFDDPEQL